jgi:hypothetical protein
MKGRYLVTMEIDTYDGDPRWWDWSLFFGEEDAWKIISSNFNGRVLEEEGEE